MGYTSLEQRKKYYTNLLDGKVKKLVWDDKREFFRFFNSKDKQLGKAIKVNAPAHKLLYKMMPDVVPSPAGYTMGVGTTRLVPTYKRNPLRSMSAQEVKQRTGLTKRQLYDVTNKLKKSGVNLNVQTVEEVLAIKEKVSTAKNKISHYIKTYFLPKTLVETKLNAPYQQFLETWNYRHKQDEMADTHMFHSFLKKYMVKRVSIFLSANKSIKVQYNLTVTFIQFDGDEIVKRDKGTFFSKITTITQPDQISGGISTMIDTVKTKIEEYLRNGSGWKIENFDDAFLNMAVYHPYSGSSYIPLPDWVQKKNACVNVKNDDNLCFLYSIICAIHSDEISTKNLSRMGQFKKILGRYPELEEMKTDMPMTVDFSKKMKRCEDIIKRDINVLFLESGSDEESIKPLRIPTPRYDESITLLLYTSGEKSHFVWVKNVSRLISREINNHKHNLVCLRCLTAHFTNKKELDKHMESCSKNEVSRIRMSDKNELKFTSIQKMLKIPFAYYGDFEAILEKEVKNQGSTTRIVNNHIPCGGAYVCVSNVDNEKGEVIKEFFERGEDCESRFLQNLVEDCRELYLKHFKEPIPLNKTKEVMEQFHREKTCHICGGDKFPSISERRKYSDKHKNKLHPMTPVTDHDHFTGLFRGKAHFRCNTAYQKRAEFPVFFHNLRGYDANFIIKCLKPELIQHVSVVPRSKDKLITFCLSVTEGKRSFKIKFLDSVAFLNASLSEIAETLDNDDFIHTKKFSKQYNNPTQAFKLLRQKGFYPYEYVTSFDRFNDKQLPPVETFVSSLTYETNNFDDLSEEQQYEMKKDYEHAKTVWDFFNCKSFGDYHDIYLKTDVYILADVMENFRRMALKEFGVDPCHYFTLPSVGFDTMLKKTEEHQKMQKGKKIERLQLFTEGEEDKYMFFEEDKTGGICSSGGVRYAKANNKYMKNYDKTKESYYLLYIDANNLYGWAMSQKLPINQLTWVDPSELNTGSFLTHVFDTVDSDFSYFLEVDAYLPQDYHDQQNDYPCFPERIVVNDEMISPYQLKSAELLGSGSSQVPKIVPNLMPKRKFKVHAKLLKLWVQHGWIVTNVHCAIRFYQEKWLEPFVTMCTDKRKQAKTEFEKAFWKLIPNSCYGKFLENVRDRCDIKIAGTEKQVKKLLKKPNLKTLPEKINDHNLMMFEMAKTDVKLDKPIYVGCAILHLSKYLMYDFWYGTLKGIYGDKVKLVYTDTDSFIFSVQTDDIYEDMVTTGLSEKFDFSAYPKDHVLYSEDNKKKVGYFKDESDGNVMTEMVGLRAKMYSCEHEDGKQKNTGKGTKKAVLKKKNHETYLNTLFHNGNKAYYNQPEKMTFIRSSMFNLKTVQITKKTLSPYDDKKYILDDGFTQYSYGHWRIDFIEMSRIYEAQLWELSG
jgi:hypothetical protein